MLGLTDPEFERIQDLLDRTPNDFELAVFSLLWSEHCGYKHSALLLKRFPTTGPSVLEGPGENAGVISVGDGLAVAFKVESHNHPSAVEPFQGAATGVGGILRDVVAMGARPIALLDGLRFGCPDWRFWRAVEGIGHYGNCVGVPTVGGDTAFDSTYDENPLVNAMCVGVLPVEQLMRAKATGPGNLVVLYGATTGRDGIGGASVLASQELSEGGESKRPSVQIGDPFTGKKLIETSLELIDRGLVRSVQDLGAAGLASSLSEMAAGGEVGIAVELDRVPLREADLEPVEIMISESQERMVAVVEPSRLADVQSVCDRWELPCAAIGEVTDNGILRADFRGETVGSIPVPHLTSEAPRYRVVVRPRNPEAPTDHRSRKASGEQLLELVRAPNIASRHPVFERYDHLVGARTVRRPGLDCAVLRLNGARGLAVSLDAAGRIARLEPRTGGSLVVLEAARNVACAGGRPLAITDCLNFGNPEKPEIAWELSEVIEGMALGCEMLDVPVVSGNVSLYNETDGRPIDPTPTVGCVGVVDDLGCIPSTWREGDVVLVAGAGEVSLDGSEYQATFLGGPAGKPPPLDLEAETGLIRFLTRSAPLVTAAHDASEGGIAVALVELALHSGLGADIDLGTDATDWFGEVGGRAIISCRPEAVPRLAGISLREIGVVRGQELLGLQLDEFANAYHEGLNE